MKAMVLAAGFGARLMPLTAKTPKPLFVIGGERVLVRQLRLLRAAGFDDIVVNAAHLGEQIAAVVDESGATLSAETHPLGAAGGIRLALARGLLPAGKPFLLVNGDIVCDYDFARLHNFAVDGCHLILAPNPPQKPRGDFDCEGGVLRQGGGHTYTGIGVYHPHLFSAITPGDKAGLLPVIRRAMTSGDASCECFGGLWADIGTHESLADIRRIMQGQQ
ncbi:MAG: sugar phosphate nucleotidyltransferase [Gammaproteobacteria bacterium]